MPNNVGPRICSYPSCGRPRYAHGLCRGHYQQYRRGNPLTDIHARKNIDATPTRIAISQAQAAGYTAEEIAREAGSAPSTIRSIIAGQPRIRSYIADLVTAACTRLTTDQPIVIDPKNDTAAPTGPVPCTGLHVKLVRAPTGWGIHCRDCYPTRWVIYGPRTTATLAAHQHRTAARRSPAC